jgi:uncharacterized protein (TIGR03000 family)
VECYQPDSKEASDVPHSIRRLALPAITSLTFLISADPALARGGGGHGGGGFRGGSGSFRGGVGGYRGGYGRDHSYDHGYRDYRGYGYGVYPYWGGSYPNYYDYGSGDYPYTSDSVYPSTSDGGAGTNVATGTSASSSGVWISPTGQSTAESVAHITVRLPDLAELRFDGKIMTESGAVREFTTPPLRPGTRYTYTVSAHWLNDKTSMDQEQKITFAPGDKVEVTFPLGSATAAQANAPVAR